MTKSEIQNKFGKIYTEIVTCPQCSKQFKARKSDLRRGRGKFCSLSCSATHINKNRKTSVHSYDIKCLNCGNVFKSGQPHTKYCSGMCKQRHYRSSVSTENIRTKTLQRFIKNLPCELCGWKETTRDVHHILPVSEGGKNTTDNLITLCPNCHRLVHKKLISEDALKEALNLRLYHHPETCQELDAYLVIKETRTPPVVVEPS